MALISVLNFELTNKKRLMQQNCTKNYFIISSVFFKNIMVIIKFLKTFVMIQIVNMRFYHKLLERNNMRYLTYIILLSVLSLSNHLNVFFSYTLTHTYIFP